MLSDELYFWLGEEAEEYAHLEDWEDYKAYLEHLEMTRLGY